MKDQGLVSVCLPAYNDEKYVGECIESIINQTYSNIEIIVCDDCSTDRTYSILESYAERYGNITLLRNSINLGIARTRNKTIKAASGDYIALMDSDDLCMPTRIENQLHSIIKNNANFCASPAEIIKKDGNTNIGYWEIPYNISQFKSLLVIKIPFAQPSVLYSKAIFDVIYYNEKEIAEDYRLWTNIFDKIKYCSTESPEVKIRINNGSFSKTDSEELLRAAHKVRIDWLQKIYRLLTDDEITAIYDSFSMSNSRNYQSLSVVSEILSDFLNKNVGSDTYVQEEFCDQFFWLCLRHIHLSSRTVFLFHSFCKKNSVKTNYKRVFLLAVLSLLKIEYGGRVFSMLKRVVGRGN